MFPIPGSLHNSVWGPRTDQIPSRFDQNPGPESQRIPLHLGRSQIRILAESRGNLIGSRDSDGVVETTGYRKHQKWSLDNVSCLYRWFQRDRTAKRGRIGSKFAQNTKILLEEKKQIYLILLPLKKQLLYLGVAVWVVEQEWEVKAIHLIPSPPIICSDLLSTCLFLFTVATAS